MVEFVGKTDSEKSLTLTSSDNKAAWEPLVPITVKMQMCSLLSRGEEDDVSGRALQAGTDPAANVGTVQPSHHPAEDS